MKNKIIKTMYFDRLHALLMRQLARKLEQEAPEKRVTESQLYRNAVADYLQKNGLLK